MGDVEKHIGSTHEKRRTFKCENCSKEFSDKSNLNTHLRTHSKEKPFKCPTCGQYFSTKGNLKDHENRHLNYRYNKYNNILKAASLFVAQLLQEFLQKTRIVQPYGQKTFLGLLGEEVKSEGRAKRRGRSSHVLT